MTTLAGVKKLVFHGARVVKLPRKDVDALFETGVQIDKIKFKIKPNFFIKFFLVIFLCGLAGGCATAPKARSVGQTLGGGIDTAITWTSKGIKKVLNK